tara:strand:- start:284 stop:661 length:378 start_codon:yes stop_codon:yes gene_type:complete
MTIDMDKEKVIDKIKRRMEKCKNITLNQFYDFKRRLDRNPIMTLLVNMLIDSENKRLHQQTLVSEYHDDIKHLDMCNRGRIQENLELTNENGDLEIEIQELKDKNCQKAIEIQNLKKIIQEIQIR